MEREVSALIKNWSRVQLQHENRTYTFFEHGGQVCICGGIGLEFARRSAEAVIALYHPQMVYSVGFAGALDPSLRIGDLFTPSTVLDIRDGSRIRLEEGSGTLLTFPHLAGVGQKQKLASAYAAQAVDMEAAAVAVAALRHSLSFAAVKVISDDATFELPGTERFIDHDGRFRAASFILFALLRPWLWLRVATLAANSHKAATALAKHLNHVLKIQQTASLEPLIARRED
jgi:adenosylhomocysteine nucleosidase